MACQSQSNNTEVNAACDDGFSFNSECDEEPENLLLSLTDEESRGAQSGRKKTRTPAAVASIFLVAGLCLGVAIFAAVRHPRSGSPPQFSSLRNDPPGQSAPAKEHAEVPNSDHGSLPLKIAVVSTSYYEPQNFDQFSDHFTSKACYAAKHGYDHWLDTSYRLPDGLHPKFAKTYVSMKLLPSYDWIFFSDDDLLIYDLEHRIEEFVEGFGDKDIHVLVPTKRRYRNDPSRLRFSNYAFLIKNSAFSMRFMQDWFDSYRTCTLAKPNTGWPDQSNMWLMIAKNIYEYHDLEVPKELAQICEPDVSTIDGMDLEGLYNKLLSDLNFTQAQSVDSKVGKIKAPIAWCDNGDPQEDFPSSGLGLNLNHVKVWKERPYIDNAFALHYKASHNSSRLTVRPHFKDKMDECFGEFYVPNMTLVEQHSASEDPVPLKDTKNMKLVSTLDEYRYGHRRSVTHDPPSEICIQTTGDIGKESKTYKKALIDATFSSMNIPNDIKVTFKNSCTDYEAQKWDYTRHVIAGTSKWESKTWKILLLRDPVDSFLSRFAMSEGISETIHAIKSSKLLMKAIAYGHNNEAELNPFLYSLDAYSRTDSAWLAKARLREFVLVIDPTQWETSRENAKNALGVKLDQKSDLPSLLRGPSEHRNGGHRGMGFDDGLRESVKEVLQKQSGTDFELYAFGQDLVEEQSSFYRQVPARGTHLIQ